MLKSWSYSLLEKYETCPYRVYLEKIVKAPQSNNNLALIRGTQIHKLAEDYLNCKIDEPPAELQNLTEHFKLLRGMEPTTPVIVEKEIAFDRKWNPVSWNSPSAWLRMKADVVVQLETMITIIDHKTGKYLGNEVKHAAQAKLYALGMSKLYPDYKHFKAEFWYIDHGKITQFLFPLEKLQKYEETIIHRAEKMLGDSIFSPKPAATKCRYCPFGKKNGSKTCEYVI